MINHLTKEQIAKLDEAKQNKVVNGSLIKKGNYVKDTTVRQ